SNVDPEVDSTAPEEPTDLVVSEDGANVSGKGEPNADVIIKDADGNIIADGKVDADGNFNVTLDKPLTNGEELEVVLKKDSGNESAPGKVTAPDTTAPDAPEAKISEDDGAEDRKSVV